jgi:hypothetical protein
MPAESPPRPTKKFVCLYVCMSCMYVCLYVCPELFGVWVHVCHLVIVKPAVGVRKPSVNAASMVEVIRKNVS